MELPPREHSRASDSWICGRTYYGAPALSTSGARSARWSSVSCPSFGQGLQVVGEVFHHLVGVEQAVEDIPRRRMVRPIPIRVLRYIHQELGKRGSIAGRIVDQRVRSFRQPRDLAGKVGQYPKTRGTIVRHFVGDLSLEAWNTSNRSG